MFRFRNFESNWQKNNSSETLGEKDAVSMAQKTLESSLTIDKLETASSIDTLADTEKDGKSELTLGLSLALPSNMS
jgi:hypothetical protein